MKICLVLAAAGLSLIGTGGSYAQEMSNEYAAPGRIYMEARFGYGPALKNLDVETESVDTQLTPAGLPVSVDANIPGTEGEITSERLYGGAIEGGYFLTDYFRIGFEGGIGRLDNRFLNLDGAYDVTANADVVVPGVGTVISAGAPTGQQVGDARLDGGATIYQGFVKAAVEVPVLHDIGFARQISVFGTAGVGLLHLDIDVEQITSSANNGASINDSDTVLAGKVGLGVATQLTDHLSLVTEANYIFGADGEFTTITTDGTRIPTSIETSAITLQTGIRLRF